MPLRSGVFEHPAFVGSTKHSDSPSASAIETPAWCVDDRSLKERSGPLPERRRRLRDHPYVGVLRNRHLRRLYLGIFVSSIGDGVAAVTVPWLALEVAGTVNRAFAVAAAATLAFLPGIPLSLVAVTGHLALGPYLIILAVSSLTRTLVAGARRTAIDQLIRPEQRLAANSLLGTCFQLGQDVLGSAAGGLLIAGPGPGVALLVDAASFAVLGALAVALPVAAQAERAEAQGPRLSVLRSVPRFVLWLIGVTFVFNFLYGPIDVGLPIFVRHSLGEGSTLYGQMFTVFGVGSLIGNLAVGGLRRESMVQWILVLSIIGWGGAALLLAVAHTPAMALLAFGLGGLLYGPSTAAVVSAIQGATPVAEQIPVMSIWAPSASGGLPLGPAAGGPPLAGWGRRSAARSSPGWEHGGRSRCPPA